MKSKRPSLVAIFYMTYFYRARGAIMPHSASPLDPLLGRDDSDIFLLF